MNQDPMPINTEPVTDRYKEATSASYIKNLASKERREARDVIRLQFGKSAPLVLPKVPDEKQMAAVTSRLSLLDISWIYIIS